MDLDRLKKLIRLANNNPNEHEANLAARKVCKLLADYKFGSTEPSIFHPGFNPNPTQEAFWAASRAAEEIRRKDEERKRNEKAARETREEHERQERKRAPKQEDPFPFTGDWDFDLNNLRGRRVYVDESLNWDYDTKVHMFFHRKTKERLTPVEYFNRYGYEKVNFKDSFYYKKEKK